MDEGLLLLKIYEKKIWVVGVLYEGGSPSEIRKAMKLKEDKLDIRKNQADCDEFQKQGHCQGSTVPFIEQHEAPDQQTSPH